MDEDGVVMNEAADVVVNLPPVAERTATGARSRRSGSTKSAAGALPSLKIEVIAVTPSPSTEECPPLPPGAAALPDIEIESPPKQLELVQFLISSKFHLLINILQITSAIA